MKNYKFLLFDVDYTLLDFDEDMKIAFKETYYAAKFHQSINFSENILSTYENHNTYWWDKFEKQECTKEELYNNRFADFLAETGLEYEPSDLNRLYFENLSKTGTPYKGAVEMMSILSKNHQCYIITNGNAVSQYRRIKNSGLGEYFKECFVSETVGVGKPHIRYFNHVFQQIPGFDKSLGLVVGDLLTADIQGAVNSGIDSIWYNPQKLPIPQSPSPTYTVSDYSGILTLFEDCKCIK